MFYPRGKRGLTISDCEGTVGCVERTEGSPCGMSLDVVKSVMESRGPGVRTASWRIGSPGMMLPCEVVMSDMVA